MILYWLAVYFPSLTTGMKQSFTHLHIEFDHLHELFEFWDLIDIPVCLEQVVPAFTHISEAGPDSRSESRDPAVL